jgi:hypothetical protein
MKQRKYTATFFNINKKTLHFKHFQSFLYQEDSEANEATKGDCEANERKSIKVKHTTNS